MEGFLQGADMGADGGLGQIKPLGGLREAAVVHDGHKDLQLPQIDLSHRETRLSFQADFFEKSDKSPLP